MSKPKKVSETLLVSENCTSEMIFITKFVTIPNDWKRTVTVVTLKVIKTSIYCQPIYKKIGYWKGQEQISVNLIGVVILVREIFLVIKKIPNSINDNDIVVLVFVTRSINNLFCRNEAIIIFSLVKNFFWQKQNKHYVFDNLNCYWKPQLITT